MKKFILISVCSIMISFMASCSDTDYDINNEGRLSSILKTSSWRVTYFVKATGEIGNTFKGYDFTFKNNNQISIYTGNDYVNGKWSAWTDEESHSRLVLDFGITPAFKNLNDDWQVLELTDEMVRMIDVNDNNGGLDYLTLERNKKEEI